MGVSSGCIACDDQWYVCGSDHSARQDLNSLVPFINCLCSHHLKNVWWKNGAFSMPGKVWKIKDFCKWLEKVWNLGFTGFWVTTVLMLLVHWDMKMQVSWVWKILKQSEKVWIFFLQRSIGALMFAKLHIFYANFHWCLRLYIIVKTDAT